MADSDATVLDAAPRTPDGSRSTRRLRREGQIPGVVYGGNDEPMSFQVEARTLRRALAHSGAVIELHLEGGSTPVLVKDVQRHPVTGDAMHIDFLRVRLDRAIQATVVLELVGGDDSPGVKSGGILEQVTREFTIEALPGAIPDQLEHDVSALEMNDTITLEAITPPEGVTLVDDPETVVATLTPPRLEIEPEEEIERETELVGDGADAAIAEGEADGAGDSDAAESQTPEG
jgi:large subunit ribosomal protein L25